MNDGYAHGVSISAAGDGSAYVTGSMSGRVSFDASLSSGYSGMLPSVFLAKYAPDGSVDWVRTVRAGTGWESSGSAVAVLPDGSGYLAGSVRGDLALDSISVVPVANVAWAMFVAEFRGDGSIQKLRQAAVIGDMFASSAPSAIVARDCAAYMIGHFSGTLTFDGSTLKTRGVDDSFVANVAGISPTQ